MPSPSSPFPDFAFDFDPTLFPNPPPLPASADLFSAAETTDLLGFLDNFGWDDGQVPYTSPPRALLQSPPPHRSRAIRVHIRRRPSQPEYPLRRDSQTPSNASESSTGESSTPSLPPAPPPPPPPRSNSNGSGSSSAPTPAPSSSKPLLSTPQKRLNHIMSEQKRRNAIRDGYAQLIAILAPAGSAAGAIAMPQRGRPKGSGARGGKNSAQTKGKSGVLFRAVEYIKWLEEGSDAMRAEVLRVESAAGIPSW
ncbi:hypothetical protein MKEN_01253700 [Mycena kentingensis (nom. inval.)]|nr:hypothetical protein MKEN_01253700 [Mycena kentingensis (nom. inval.)]